MPTATMHPMDDHEYGGSAAHYGVKNTFLDEHSSDSDDQPTMLRTQTAPAYQTKNIPKANFRTELEPLCEELSQGLSHTMSQSSNNRSEVSSGLNRTQSGPDSTGNAKISTIDEHSVTPMKKIGLTDDDLIKATILRNSAEAASSDNAAKYLGFRASGNVVPIPRESFEVDDDDDSPPVATLQHTSSVNPHLESTAVHRYENFTAENASFLDDDTSAAFGGLSALDRAITAYPAPTGGLDRTNSRPAPGLEDAVPDLDKKLSEMKMDRKQSEGQLQKKVSFSAAGATAEELHQILGTASNTKTKKHPKKNNKRSSPNDSRLEHATSYASSSATSDKYPYGKLSPSITKLQDRIIDDHSKINAFAHLNESGKNAANNTKNQFGSNINFPTAYNVQNINASFAGTVQDMTPKTANMLQNNPLGMFTPAGAAAGQQNATLVPISPPNASPSVGPYGFRDSSGNLYLPQGQPPSLVLSGSTAGTMTQEQIQNAMYTMNQKSPAMQAVQYIPAGQNNFYAQQIMEGYSKISPTGSNNSSPQNNYQNSPMSSGMNDSGRNSGKANADPFANVFTKALGNAAMHKGREQDRAVTNKGQQNQNAVNANIASGAGNNIDNANHYHSYGKYDWQQNMNAAWEQAGGATGSRDSAHGLKEYEPRHNHNGKKSSYYVDGQGTRHDGGNHHADPKRHDGSKDNLVNSIHNARKDQQKSKYPNRNYKDHHVIHANEDPTPGTFELAAAGWHDECKDFGTVRNVEREHGDNTFFIKNKNYHELLSSVTERQVRSGGRYRYCVRFQENADPQNEPVDYGMSPADGFGFIFAEKLPCPKNIQRIRSIFLSKKGIVSIRRQTEVTRCKEFSIRPFESGDYIFMEIDLMSKTCAFWIEGKDSCGRTNGPPKHHRFNYGGCFPVTKHGLDRGYMSVVLKNRGVAAQLVKYEIFK